MMPGMNSEVYQTIPRALKETALKSTGLSELVEDVKQYGFNLMSLYTGGVTGVVRYFLPTVFRVIDHDLLGNNPSNLPYMVEELWILTKILGSVAIDSAENFASGVAAVVTGTGPLGFFGAKSLFNLGTNGIGEFREHFQEKKEVSDLNK